MNSGARTEGSDTLLELEKLKMKMREKTEQICIKYLQK